MSAYKTATIRLGEAEYQRLREAEEQLRLLRLQNRDSRRHSSTQENESIYNRMLKDQKKRDQAFQTFQSGLADEIGELENRTHRMLQTQTDQLRKQIESNQHSSFGQYQSQIDQWLVNIEDQISNQERTAQLAWDDQNQRIASIEARDQKIVDYAVHWLQSTQDLLDLIQSQYVMESGEANEWAFQMQSMDQAVQQYHSGLYELTGMTALQTYMQASRLRAKLEAKEKARLIKIAELERMAANTVDQIRENQVVSAMDNDGNLLDDTLEVDYWMKGEYSPIVEAAEQLIHEMHQQPYLDQGQIQYFVNTFQKLQDQSIELVTQARLTVLASQLRFNVAQIIVRALESQGFFLERASYQQGDYRDSFIATTRNFSGNEVVVTLDPDLELDEGGRLQIVSTDAGEITQHELLQRNQEIFSAIESQGVSVGNIQSSDEKPAKLENLEHPISHKKALHLPTLEEKH